MHKTHTRVHLNLMESKVMAVKTVDKTFLLMRVYPPTYHNTQRVNSANKRTKMCRGTMSADFERGMSEP